MINRSFSTTTSSLHRFASSKRKSLVTKLWKESEEKLAHIERREKPSSFLHKKAPDYILPNFNENPPTFPQTVVQSDGSTFTMRVCTPRPFLTLSKDTRNNPLWNPELDSLYDDSAAQLTKFAEKYGDMNLSALGNDAVGKTGGDDDVLGFGLELPSALNATAKAPPPPPPSSNQNKSKKNK